MKKRVKAVTVALAMCLAALGSQAQVACAQGKLRIATEGTYPPWSFKDVQGNVQGWDVEVANALCAKMKAQCEIIAQDWEGIIPSLLAKKYDAIVASMAMTPARRERIAFTNKYKDVVSQFVAKKGTIDNVSAAGLKGKKIGVQRGSAQHKYLEAEGYDKSAELKLYDKTTDAELDLLAGRVDVIVGNKVTYFVGFMKKSEAKDYDFVGPELKGGVFGDGAGIGLRKEDTDLMARFNKALDEIREDGSYDKIAAKYFPFKLM